MDDEWLHEPDPEGPPDVLAAAEELKGYLFKAIASLRGVQSVEQVSYYSFADIIDELH